MSDQQPAETFEIPLEAAETYEAVFVPALFAEWAPLVAGAAGLAAGQAVLDAACGTGVVAREAARRVGPEGRVAGVDRNEAMLTVARRVRPDLEWHRADVADLPFADGEFDAVLCQMALMFFPDRAAALRELGRVTADGGTVVLAVPAAIGDQPAYRPFVDVAARHAGPEAMSLLGTYWSCGEVADLRAWCAAAGLEVRDVRTHTGTARFASADDLVATEVGGSPLAGRITPEVYEAIRADTAVALAEFAAADGLRAPLVGHVVSCGGRGAAGGTARGG
jgi:SAM-dependent methyltransferase